MNARLLLMVASLAAVTTVRQKPSVAGTWQVTFDSDLRRDGEKVTVTKRSKGELTLQQRGDSVFGTFKTDGLDSARPLAGTFDGKTLKLTTGANRTTIRMNGKPVEMVVRTDWMGALDAAGMRGTMFIQMGERPAPPRKWEATR
ncbi:MAG TPA: hypothetical protein VM076_22255 [Gemmatimonadaceae bacterium]|nr:hypothetical protein [Gemmatimonadaceae bacterium]